LTIVIVVLSLLQMMLTGCHITIQTEQEVNTNTFTWLLPQGVPGFIAYRGPWAFDGPEFVGEDPWDIDAGRSQGPHKRMQSTPPGFDGQVEASGTVDGPLSDHCQLKPLDVCRVVLGLAIGFSLVVVFRFSLRFVPQLALMIQPLHKRRIGLTRMIGICRV
jgi:hypothetical protein